MDRCEWCDKPLPDDAPEHRKYCGVTHRVAAHEANHRRRGLVARSLLSAQTRAILAGDDEALRDATTRAARFLELSA